MNNSQSQVIMRYTCSVLSAEFDDAFLGILEDNIEPVDRYLACGGSIARPMTADEVRLLNRPSAFDVGHTLVHLAVRFQRRNILALILKPEVSLLPIALNNRVRSGID